MDSDTLAENNKLVAAVYMITYNQERFIAQAIESVMNQKTDFAYRLFLGEDCSTDSTREICLQLQKQYPEKIHLVLNECNLGPALNAKNVFELSFGSEAEYIALIEGDDYWTDPLKLQKQVDFLKNNKEYSLTFHKICPFPADLNEELSFNNPDTEQEYTIEDLAEGNFIHTPSVVFRKNFNRVPEWFPLCPIGDYPLHLLNASYGRIKYFPEPMAVYRTGSGTWSSKSLAYQIINIMFTLKILLHHFKDNASVAEKLQEQFSRHYRSVIKSFDLQYQPDHRHKNLHYLESIINFSSLLRIMKLKIIKKFKFGRSLPQQQPVKTKI